MYYVSLWKGLVLLLYIQWDWDCINTVLQHLDYPPQPCQDSQKSIISICVRIDGKSTQNHISIISWNHWTAAKKGQCFVCQWSVATWTCKSGFPGHPFFFFLQYHTTVHCAQHHTMDICTYLGFLGFRLISNVNRSLSAWVETVDIGSKHKEYLHTL